MPACPNGARPNAAGQDAQVWIDRANLALDVANLLKRSAPLFFASIAAELVDINSLCEENLSPPPPFTALDLVELTATVPLFGTLGNTRAAQKAYAWMRYSQFLTYCECVPIPTTPTNNCFAAASLPLNAAFDSVTGPFPITVDQAVLDSWTTHPNGSWDRRWRGHGTVSGGPVAANDVLLDVLHSDGSWLEIDDMQDLGAAPDICAAQTMQASVPRISTASGLRIRNRTGVAQTLTNFEFCFCAVDPVPPSLPVQDPLVDVPSAPVLVCEGVDLCIIIQQLQRSLLNLAAQVSDIQASVSGRDQLSVISSIPIAGEGEVTMPLGVRLISIELETLGPDAFTSALGRPRGLMRVGSVRYGDGVGYSPRRFIDADRFDDEPTLGALSVSWQLLTGTSGVLKFLG